MICIVATILAVVLLTFIVLSDKDREELSDLYEAAKEPHNFEPKHVDLMTWLWKHGYDNGFRDSEQVEQAAEKILFGKDK